MDIIQKIPDTARKIKGSEDWIDVDGTVYAIDRRNRHHPNIYKKAQYNTFGYQYCNIWYGNKTVKKRVHRIVAETFIPNPNNYTIVGHRNNIKNDNRVENLYWTTTSENTKKAFDDGLAKNDEGFSDSQSMPVIMYETKTNEFIEVYGSIKEASRMTGINASTIARQAKYKRPVRKPYYFRYINDPSTK